MKIKKTLKYAGLMALALGVIGCAGAPVEEVEAEPVVAEDQELQRAALEAIREARAAMQSAEAQGADLGTVPSLIADAEAANEAGEYAQAISLANQATREAQEAIARLQREAAAAEVAADTYTVVRGDNLWNIAGREAIYGNPFHWPLIYRANSDQIRDADLIYPGQQFVIERNVSARDMDAAARHARTRGAWTLGVVEASDRAYLAGN